MSDKHIYFMRPVGQIGPIKIGCSKEPEGRLAAMAIQSPLRLEIIATAPGTHADERRLHGMFAKHWTHHEWFGASKELLALVAHVERHGELPELPAGEIVRLPRKKTGAGSGGSRPPSRKMIEFGSLVRPEYEAGASATQIAARHGCWPSRVCKALKAVGVTLKRGTRNPRKGVADQSRAAEFKRRYLGGDTLKAIGDDYGLTRERVRQILRKTEVPSLGYRPEHWRQAAPVTAQERAIGAEYLAGATLTELKAKYPDAHVESALMRARAVGIKQKAKSTEKTTRVAEAYLRGDSVDEIAARLGMPFKTEVYRWLKKAGVPPRTNKGRHRKPAQVAA